MNLNTSEFIDSGESNEGVVRKLVLKHIKN